MAIGAGSGGLALLGYRLRIRQLESARRAGRFRAPAARLASKEIADELGIHYRTVENYRSNICAKLNLRGSHALIKFALQHQAEL